MHSRPARSRLTPLVALLSVMACARSDKPPATDSLIAAPAAAISATEPPVITIVATDFAYEAPDTISSGMVTLRLVNKGPELHHVSMMRLAAGKTFGDFDSAMKAMKPTDAPPEWMETVPGPNAPLPGGEQSLTQELSPGSYVLICFIPSADHVPHFAKGMVRHLTVIPATAPSAPAPVADVTVKMSDYAWAISPEITAGKHVIRLENSAAQPHEMFIAKLEKGKTALDAAAWSESPTGPPPAVPMGGVSAMAKGTIAYLPVDLTPGEYALLCFIPDMKDGKAHYHHGMMKTFVVT
ncbi:MAG: hypothetical protein ABI910_09815 [Gemmatimonadota bacterium]